ncbi:hypothetical protein I3760_16G066200 [Carya illinoinensis]|nr:hypothetical protein I3760_16G066200 [Carya illinoinensis]
MACRWIGQDLVNSIIFEKMPDTMERLNRSLMACQDKFEAAKLQKKLSGLHELESCVDQSTQDNIKMLPHVAGKLKASFSSVIREKSHLIF